MYKKFVDAKYPLSIYLKFALLVSLAYLPMWSFLMSLKNDALTLSYPPFRFFSDQLGQGHTPWWHYQLHMGFPLHADPGFPFWSPITWIWAVAGSSLYIYTFLVYSYVLIGGIGVLKLAGWLKFGETTRLFLALAFCVSGFFSSHLQHPHYIFEAAFVPFALLCFFKLIYYPGWRNTLFFSISIFFLVNSGYPSFTIAATYFFTILLVCIAIFERNISMRRALPYLCSAIAISVLLSLPFLYSVYQFLPFYNRSVSAAQTYIGVGGMSSRSLLSLLFPLASVVDPVFFQTDRSWSNISIGLLAIMFAVYAFSSLKHSLKWPLVISGSSMLAASMHGVIKELLYKILPLFDLLHSNGGLRIYYILSTLVLAGFGMEHFLKSANQSLFKRIALTIMTIFIGAIVLSFILLPSPSSGNGLREFFKNLSLRNAIVIQSVLGIITMMAMLFASKHKRTIITVGFAELILAFMLNLPFTGLGLNTTFEMQRRLNVTPINYSTYPSGLRSYFAFVNSGGLKRQNINSRVSDLKITGDRISFNGVTQKKNDTIVIAQNFYPNWKFFVNGKQTTTLVAHGTFIAIPVKEGSFEVKGVYKPTGVIVCFVISIFAWAITGTALLKKALGGTNVYRNN